MSPNSSSFDDITLPPHLSSFNSSVHHVEAKCFLSNASVFTFAACSVTNLLLLPLFLLVLFLGYQQWRRQLATSRPAVSHADIFTYHSVVMQLHSVVGISVYFCCGYMNLHEPAMMGFGAWSVTTSGQSLFHALTCVERYLAVVKPITYRGLSRARGVRIRNVSAGCVWLLSCVYVSVSWLGPAGWNAIVYCCSMGLLSAVVSICSISALCALRRPGPGAVGGNRERVDQSKQRAVYTIVAILGALLFRFGGSLMTRIIEDTVESGLNDVCSSFAAYWLNLPSSLVLPLLFLQRAGKLGCCKQTTKSG